MQRSFSRITLRNSLFFALSLVAVAALLGSAVPLASSWARPAKKSEFKFVRSGAPYLNLQEGRELETVYGESAASAQGHFSGEARPLALASGDIDIDGFTDLICGYAGPSGGFLTFHRGNREALAPADPGSLEGIAKGQFPEPFLEKAAILNLPEAPDFIATGDFNRDGSPDVIVAARGSNGLYLLSGDRHGGFASIDRISLPGAVTAMLGDDLNERDGMADLVVGVSSDSGPAILVFDAASSILASTPAIYPLPAEARSLAAGDLDDDRARDVGVVAGSQLFILHGRKQLPSLDGRRLNEQAGQLERVNLSFAARAIAVGDFIWDRDNRTEIAVMFEDGSVHIAARGKLDSRPMTVDEMRLARRKMAKQRKEAEKAIEKRERMAVTARRSGESLNWEVVEDVSASELPAAPSVSNQGLSDPALLGARMSGLPSDDLVILNMQAHRLQIVSRKGPDQSGQLSVQSVGRSSLDIEFDDEIAAALPMRVNVDGRPGLVVLAKSRKAPLIFTPLANNTFIVNTANDTDDASVGDGVCADSNGDCSLRAAIQEANFDLTNDTITFSASLNGVPIKLTQTGNDSNAGAGDLDINSNMTITGNGAANTIIQGADDASFTNSIGDKIFGINQDGIFDSLTVSFSGVTIRYGRNTVPFGDPSFAYTGGGVDAFLTGSGNSITFTACTIDNNANAFSYGGGVNIDSFTFGISGGTVSFIGCTISNNQLQATTTVQSGAGANLFADVHDVVFTNCTITGNQAQNSNVAAGINIRHTNGGTITINGTDVTNNTAGSHSGGIQTGFNQTVNMNIGTISGNSAGGDGGGVNASGGINNLSNLTISNNSAASSGGGLFVAGATLNVSLSRIAGNTAATGSGIAQTGGIAMVENNWWGCDGFPGAAGCQTGSGTFDANPRIDLRLLPTSSILGLGGTQGFTADVSQNTNGATINPFVLNGLTILFSNTAGLGNVSPGSALLSGLTASTTFTANSTCPSPNTGTVSATLDNGTQTSSVAVQEAPAISSCPADQIVSADLGQCSASVSFTAPTATAGCPAPVVTCKIGATPITSPHVFPVGVSTVTCTASNGVTPNAFCSFSVTVNDTQPPTIGPCPANITTDDNPAGSGSATVTYSAPGSSDNCPGQTVTCNPPSGSSFPVGATTVTCTAMDASSNTASCQFTVTVNSQGLSALSPAMVWIGLKNSDDVGTRFDLLAEVLKNGSVVGSGQLDDVPGGSSGFNNAVLRTITLAVTSSVGIGAGDTLSFRLSVRIAATSGHNSGTARLWYNGAAVDSGNGRDAGSRFGATIAGSSSNYFLRTAFALSTAAGSSRTFVDKLVSKSGGNPFVAFGTWSITF
ncbi:MAG TPA: HYR domain-containing protein [Blastocatellia bacterium]|nr:HYR domain-containing protein [Blastocatellia bacterium]